MASKKKKKITAAGSARTSSLKQENSAGITLVIPVAFGLLITTITGMAFSPALQNDFTNWDDETYVINNPLVAAKSISVTQIFSTPVSLNYHPLTILTLAWNYQSAKLNPYNYHLTNLWLHVLNTLLVFLFVFQLTRRRLLPASFTAIVFGIHPLHVESVAWVSERKDVLYVFFLLLALISYLRFSENRNWFWLGAAFLLFIAACLSKAMAVVFPVLMLLIDFFRNQKITLRMLLEKVPFFIVSLIVSVVAFQIQAAGAVAKPGTFSLLQRFLFAGYGGVMYLVKFFVPVNLSAFYPYPTLNDQLHLPAIYYLVPAVMLLLLGSLWVFRKHKAYVTGIVFYLVSVALVLQFIAVGNAIMADRYTYLAYIGPAFAIGWYLNEWLVTSRNVNAILLTAAVVTVLSLILVPQTRYRCAVWKNSETLWTDVIERYPMKVETAYRNRGNYYAQSKETDKAYADYMRLLHMDSKESKVFSNLGNVYALQGNVDSALWAYDRAAELDSTNVSAYFNSAVTNLGLGRYAEAAADARRGLRINPSSSKGYGMLGFALLQTGNYRESVDAYSASLRFNSDNGDAYFYRGRAYQALGDSAAANRDFAAGARYGKTPTGN